jgi:hypothetical protein
VRFNFGPHAYVDWQPFGRKEPWMGEKLQRDGNLNSSKFVKPSGEQWHSHLNKLNFLNNMY